MIWSVKQTHGGVNMNFNKDITIGEAYKGCGLVNADKVKTVSLKKVQLKELYPDEKLNWAKDILEFADKVEGRNK